MIPARLALKQLAPILRAGQTNDDVRRGLERAASLLDWASLELQAPARAVAEGRAADELRACLRQMQDGPQPPDPTELEATACALSELTNPASTSVAPPSARWLDDVAACCQRRRALLQVPGGSWAELDAVDEALGDVLAAARRAPGEPPAGHPLQAIARLCRAEDGAIEALEPLATEEQSAELDAAVTVLRRLGDPVLVTSARRLFDSSQNPLLRGALVPFLAERQALTADDLASSIEATRNEVAIPAALAFGWLGPRARADWMCDRAERAHPSLRAPALFYAAVALGSAGALERVREIVEEPDDCDLLHISALAAAGDEWDVERLLERAPHDDTLGGACTMAADGMGLARARQETLVAAADPQLSLWKRELRALEAAHRFEARPPGPFDRTAPSLDQASLLGQWLAHAL